MKMRLAEIAKALQVQSIDEWEKIIVTSVSFDTRTLKPGALFIPLVGKQDGHNYIAKAVEKGAVASLWQEDHDRLPENSSAFPLLDVENSLQALQDLAGYYLHKINPKVVAVTGSNGKTTTKDMIAAILKTQFNVRKTQANFNNHIGVPMTILGMEPNTEALVVEMGMDHFGELDKLSRLVEPDVAVITMIGEAHIEFFGTRDKIADAKMEITHGLKEDGILVYNGDEPLLRQRVKAIEQPAYTFGSEAKNDVQALNIVGDESSTSFRVKNWPDYNFIIHILGTYNVGNALAALSVGDHFRIPVEKMVTALANFDLTQNRTQWVQGNQGEKILSDVYNSNPTAAKMVLQAFLRVKTRGQRYVVLGDMLELGRLSNQLHAELADVLDPEKIAAVFLCGNKVAALAANLTDKFSDTRVHLYPADHKEQLIHELKESITADDIVMLKGSHGIHLEKVLEALRK
ncbi:UDP-N-acetylmuramoyl-tripeptide--D-alanyl-D-alanine ligase [Liquorilactobacillus capillatus]|uniref:UDP-N-acetylmuramoyl-tripeptide--D-alanyl-D-alanine ligase n=1 Tax=Liquorilactobacillus capillatus DSM 19910 TaxID=1423731 RepID=A0A0R1M1J5_9LACO|nr:UDP-N-acetylmuramoyl-tripeptide--D-alanyl-D-alanine ligase [Liquorilactobacillus capillatus]KRL01852.1 UDP-N-acetylmuramoyl-tripeptide--D-alanyl-D-alanine ligase [Liquorilactobacillus capillatus DSM 19910]